MRLNLTEHVFQKKMGEKWREKKFRENPPPQHRTGVASALRAVNAMKAEQKETQPLTQKEIFW